MTTGTYTRCSPMDDIGAGDIAVGQRWRHVTGRKSTEAKEWEVTSIDGDHVRLFAFDDDGEVCYQRVSFGSLLAYWVLLR